MALARPSRSVGLSDDQSPAPDVCNRWVGFRDDGSGAASSGAPFGRICNTVTVTVDCNGRVRDSDKGRQKDETGLARAQVPVEDVVHLRAGRS